MSSLIVRVLIWDKIKKKIHSSRLIDGLHMDMLAIWWDGDYVSLGSFAQNTKVMINLLN